jgi:flagellar basal body-associated protein FliL
MKITIIILFILFSCSIEAYSFAFSQKDSLPAWKEFKRMKKSELVNYFRNDSIALKIITAGSKKEKSLLFSGIGFIAVATGVFILGDLITISGPALSSLFIMILLGILFLTLIVSGLTLIIFFFAGKKKYTYNRLKKYYQNNQSNH